MLRKFTKAIGRYKVGETHDYPASVWRVIERNAKAKLDSFTKEMSNDALLQNPYRGPAKVHKRLGT